MARRLAEFLFGSMKHLIRFDLSEYMEKMNGEGRPHRKLPIGDFAHVRRKPNLLR